MENKTKSADSEQSVIFQIARFISINDVYINLCSTNQNFIFNISEDFSKDNLYVLLLSNLYSLFDDQKSAQSLKKITFKDSQIENLRNEIIKDWSEIEKPVKIIRHNIGCHTAENIEGLKNATSQAKELGEKPFELIKKLYQLFLIIRNNQM